MKKARIVLSMVLIMGLTAGVFAFKANRYMAQVYYTCNTYWQTCGMTWTIGGFMTTLPDPVAIYTITQASPNTAVFGRNCGDNCTWSNTVYIEPGF